MLLLLRPTAIVSFRFKFMCQVCKHLVSLSKCWDLFYSLHINLPHFSLNSKSTEEFYKSTLEICIICEQGKFSSSASECNHAEQHITYPEQGLQSNSKIKVQSRPRSLGTFLLCRYQVPHVLAVARISIKGVTAVLDCNIQK